MAQTMDTQETASITEMAVVDTFTKLIFGQESQYSGSELGIIDAFRIIDDNVTLDCHHDMGVYLRALGVQEMIGLVSAVSSGMAQGVHLEGTRIPRPDVSIPALGRHH